MHGVQSDALCTAMAGLFWKIFNNQQHILFRCRMLWMSLLEIHPSHFMMQYQQPDFLFESILVISFESNKNVLIFRVHGKEIELKSFSWVCVRTIICVTQASSIARACDKHTLFGIPNCILSISERWHCSICTAQIRFVRQIFTQSSLWRT